MPIVENAINVKVEELSNDIINLYKYFIATDVDKKDIVILGKRHGIWFVANNTSEIIDKAMNINNYIKRFNEEIEYLNEGKIICKECREIIDKIDNEYCHNCGALI